jgi:hypothetical protein
MHNRREYGIPQPHYQSAHDQDEQDSYKRKEKEPASWPSASIEGHSVFI